MTPPHVYIQTTKTPLVSIIVPVYAVEDYIDRALNSIIHQTYTNTEIIIINDATPDESMNIVNKLYDSRIRIIHHPTNQGLAKSRNDGIEAAKGEYIIFLDSDDYLDRNFIEKLLQAALKSGADVAMANTKIIQKNKTIIHKNKNQIISNYFKKIQSLPNGASWNKIYKKTLIENHKIRFPIGKYWEDNIFTIKVCFYSNFFITIDSTNYNYCIRENSITTSTSAQKINKLKEDSLFIAQEILNFNKSKTHNKKEKETIYNFMLSNLIHEEYLQDITYKKYLHFLLKNKEYTIKSSILYLTSLKIKCFACRLVSLLPIQSVKTRFRVKYNRIKLLIKLNSNLLTG